ncbi:hypothetical protein ACFR9U_14650 [Halorientalis brevis]|uniref:Uncharacterized protein n=1 Tax=Halorientalis brevis TaxID=1126241 RepID=A0ABD6CDY6_9EURY|nr:hypothetical protein [Halorientalis brevis]
MKGNTTSLKKVSTDNYGALADKRRDPREEQLTVAMAQKVSGPEHMLQQVAKTQSGDELDFRPNKGKDSRANYYDVQDDYNWTRDPDVAPARRAGETLAQQERRLAREDELTRHRTLARDAHEAGVNRAQSCRVQNAADTPSQRTTADERPDVGLEDSADPRERLTQDDLAAVNRVAMSLADELGHDVQLGRAGLAKLVARRVRSGADPIGAATAVKRSLQRLPDVAETFTDLDQFTTWKTTVDVTVDKLFAIPAPSQYQAGYVEDANGDRRKFVYWEKSHKASGMPTLREGDEVRLEDVAVNVWHGQACLAILGDTAITFDKRGDGPAHRSGTRTDAPTIGPWKVDSDTHAWIETADSERALEHLAD